MYGTLLNFAKTFTDKRFARRTSSLFVVAYSFAAWKYPQNVPSLIDCVWFDAMKGQYEARCQDIGSISNLTNKTTSRTGNRRKQGHTDESKGHNPPENEIRIVLVAATEFAKKQAVKCFMPTDQGCYTHVTKNNEAILKTLPKIKVNSKEYKIDIINMPAVPKDLPSHQEVGHEICKTLTLSSPGPHALLLCIPATELANSLNYTSALRPYEKLFGDEIYDFVIIVLTRYDEIYHKGSSTLRKKTNLSDEFAHAVANNTVLKKIENVMNNQIILEARLSRDEKDMKWKEVIGIINKTRTRRKEKGKREFASCNLTEEAENDLQKLMQTETAVGTQSLRDNMKKDKHHLEHVCS